MAMLNAKRFTYVLAAGEAARRYAQQNPESAAGMIDRVVEFVDVRTNRRWTRLLDDIAAFVKKGVIGRDIATAVRQPTVVAPGAPGASPSSADGA